MESLRVATVRPACCSPRAGPAVCGQVKGANGFRRHDRAFLQTNLASRASSYLMGSANVGALKIQNIQKPSVVLKGPRCESVDGSANSKVDIWIGRAAMLGFVAAIGIEVASGKGVLANIGIGTPAPTLALALTAVVGGLVAFGVFRSAASSE